MFEKLNVGIDIVKISRFNRLPYSQNKKFYEKIFTKLEIEYCIHFKDPYPHFAGKFALKEAVIKSIKNKINLNEIQILSKRNKPIIKISKTNSYQFHASLSHDGDYAIAIVISNEI